MINATKLYIQIGQILEKKDVNIPQVEFKPDTFKNTLSIVFSVMGAISVVIITLAGIKYTMSMGEASAVKKAKDTILYAFIGLFVSILAVTIINLVIGETR